MTYEQESLLPFSKVIQMWIVHGGDLNDEVNHTSNNLYDMLDYDSPAKVNHTKKTQCQH